MTLYKHMLNLATHTLLLQYNYLIIVHIHKKEIVKCYMHKFHADSHADSDTNLILIL